MSEKLITKEMILDTKPCYTPEIEDGQVWTFSSACLDKSFPAHDRLYVLGHLMTEAQVEKFSAWCLKEAFQKIPPRIPYEPAMSPRSGLNKPPGGGSSGEPSDPSYDPLYYLDQIIAWSQSKASGWKKVKSMGMNLALGRVASFLVSHPEGRLDLEIEKVWDEVMKSLSELLNEKN